MRQALAHDLNEIIRKGPFPDKDFDQLDLSPRTRQLREKKPQEGDQMVRLNRLLLEDAYPEIARNSGRVRDAWLRLFDAHGNDWHLVNNRGYYTVLLTKQVLRCMTLGVVAATLIVTSLLTANGAEGWHAWAAALSMIMGVFGASLSVLIQSRSKTTSAVTFRRSLAEIPLRLALGGAAGLVTFMIRFPSHDYTSDELDMIGFLMAFASGFSEKLALEQVMDLVLQGGSGGNGAKADENGKR